MRVIVVYHRRLKKEVTNEELGRSVPELNELRDGEIVVWQLCFQKKQNIEAAS